jgi:hypothetical protein
MTAAPSLILGGADLPVRELIGVLNENRRVKASDLMPRLGIFSDDAASAVSGFVAFINITIRARQVLERNGFWLMRTGGTPSDKYWIEPQGLSS